MRYFKSALEYILCGGLIGIAIGWAMAVTLAFCFVMAGTFALFAYGQVMQFAFCILGFVILLALGGMGHLYAKEKGLIDFVKGKFQ